MILYYHKAENVATKLKVVVVVVDDFWGQQGDDSGNNQNDAGDFGVRHVFKKPTPNYDGGNRYEHKCTQRRQ